MLAALIIVFREVFEAGLIVGIVLAVTRSVPHRNRWIGGGVLAGKPSAFAKAPVSRARVAAFFGHGAGAVYTRVPGAAPDLFHVGQRRCVPRQQGEASGR